MAVADRRSEERVEASGEAWLLPDDPAAEVIHGRLLDISPSGLRIAHSSAPLDLGTRVRYRHAAAEGLATVVWNRHSGGTVETGLFVAR